MFNMTKIFYIPFPNKGCECNLFGDFFTLHCIITYMQKINNAITTCH